MTPSQAYVELVSRSKERAYLESVADLLAWDQRTHIPRNGHGHRAGQMTVLAETIHKLKTDPRLEELLSAAEPFAASQDPSGPELVNLREWRRELDRWSRVPQRLISESAREEAEALASWERARPCNDWQSFRPHLEKVVALKRELAEALGYAREPYDALLAEYETTTDTAAMQSLFNALREVLVSLLDRIRGSSRRPDLSVRHGGFPRDEQEAFGRSVVRQIGYDFRAGRLDSSAHPFTVGIGPGDVRIATRYNGDFNEGFFGILHEAGHALYDQGLPAEHWGTPMGRSLSLGLHESQSRLWENFVGRSQCFWDYFYPRAQDRFAHLAGVPLDAFHFAVNDVSPGAIRADADEVTYDLHVLVRFELERDLMRRDLEVADLPTAWDDRMERYLGIRPRNLAEGLMQDVHWSRGVFGYFPTYTLGNLCAAQLLAAARKALGNLDTAFACGDFSPLLNWLREKVHAQGGRYHSRDLLKAVTGEDLNPHYFISYLEAKYCLLYDV